MQRAVPTSPTQVLFTAERIGVGLALLSAAASGTLSLWAKLGGQAGMSSATMLSWRFLLLTALLFAFGFWKVQRKEARSLLLLGLLHAAPALCYFSALGHISAGTAALLLSSAPAFVIVIGLMSRIYPSRWQVVALAVTLLGLGVILGKPSAADANFTGLALGGLAGMLYGGYFFASHRLTQGIKPLTVTAYVGLVTAVCVGLFGAITGDLAVPSGLESWGVILAMVLIPSLISMPALYKAVQRIGATRTSMLTTTDPMWAVLLAVTVLGEALSLAQIVGGALILLGAGLAQRENKTAKRRASRGKIWGNI